MIVIVTGTGRCGTGYMAHTLTAAGLPCGHEHTFTTHGPHPHRTGPDDSDSSWLAVPHLHNHPEAVVLLPYRAPTEVIGSFLGIRFFHDDSPYRTFLYQHHPELEDMTPADAANHHYTHWNLRALKHADIVYPITNPPWDHIGERLNLNPEHLRHAIATTSTRNNARRRQPANSTPVTGHAHTTHHILQEHTTT